VSAYTVIANVPVTLVSECPLPSLYSYNVEQKQFLIIVNGQAQTM